jgi:hypothetical protein
MKHFIEQAGQRAAWIGVASVLTVAGCGPMDEADSPTSNTEAAIVRMGTVQDNPSTVINGNVQTFIPTALCGDVGGLQMHCCPPGYAMRGVHAGNNVLRCVSIVPSGVDPEAGCHTVGSPPYSLRADMLACPVGEYVRGLHAGQTKIRCCPYPASNQPSSRKVDGNAGTRIFEGITDPPESATNETAPANISPRTTMHVCNTQTPVDWGRTNIYVMEGIHINRNELLCAF